MLLYCTSIYLADKGLDSEFFPEPNDLERLCHDAKDAWLALGKPGFERQRAEAGSKVFRRSLYLVKDIEAGERLTQENLRRIRPGMGLPPKYYQHVLGRCVKQKLRRGTALQLDHLNDQLNDQ